MWFKHFKKKISIYNTAHYLQNFVYMHVIIVYTKVSLLFQFTSPETNIQSLSKVNRITYLRLSGTELIAWDS